MITKARMSLIRSLDQKKYRQAEQLYVAEGVRVAEEALTHSSEQVVEIYATEKWIQNNPDLVRRYADKVFDVTETQLERFTLLRTPNEVLVLMKMEKQGVQSVNFKKGKFSLILDDIQDPGNMGTILRIADWFGFEQIICSPNSVDIYNPKVVQSTMGSIFRSKVIYTELKELLQHNKTAENPMPVWAATLKGQNAWSLLDTAQTAQTGGFLMIGNEAHGIKEEHLSLCTAEVAIPSYGEAESLNAAIATSILCAILRKHS